MNKEIVIIMGYMASGKSTLVKDFENQGFFRINRDESGGTLDDQNNLVREAFGNGKNKVVLDNTYITIESRQSIILLAKELNVPIRCVWLDTSFEDSQFNACFRMMEKLGKILSPVELKNCKNPNFFPPAALYAARNKFEGKDEKLKIKGKQHPTEGEGFYKVEKVKFVRKWTPEYCNKALILDFDDTLRKSIGPNPWPEKPTHVQILKNRTEVLNKYKNQGYLLLGASNQSAIAKGLSVKDCEECFERTLELLKVKIEYSYCPHKVPPVSCYCRKPAPGMGINFIFKYKLNPNLCIMVGDSTSDKTFANRCGFQFQTPEQFFGA